jgi:hypothetical protein
MSGNEVASILAVESTRRHLTEPHEANPSRSRRTAAHRLQAWAHRLDPLVAAPPRAQVQH